MFYKNIQKSAFPNVNGPKYYNFHKKDYVVGFKIFQRSYKY